MFDFIKMADLIEELRRQLQKSKYEKTKMAEKIVELKFQLKKTQMADKIDEHKSQLAERDKVT